MNIEQRSVDVSVIVLTYFHEKYVAQALDSILVQETGLRYEILVGDDASGDRTPEIIQEYAARYPGIIKPILRKKNLGATRNAVDLFYRAKGKYLASLEGDDFWLDKHKMQKQWEFLERHPKFSACGGKCLIVDENGQPDYTRTLLFSSNKKVFELNDLADRWQIPAQSSTVMRRNIFLNLKREDTSIIFQAHPTIGDKTVTLLFLTQGPIYCSNEILAYYRQVIKKGGRNWSSVHREDQYWNYDNYMYPKRLELWSRKKLGYKREFGNRNGYHFCSFVQDSVKKPSLKRLWYLGKMIAYSRQPVKYSWYILKALIEME